MADRKSPQSESAEQPTKAGAVELNEQELDHAVGGEWVKLDLKEVIVSSVSTGSAGDSPARSRSGKIKS